jgi:hypothetical protein
VNKRYKFREKVKYDHSHGSPIIEEKKCVGRKTKIVQQETYENKKALLVR